MQPQKVNPMHPCTRKSDRHLDEVDSLIELASSGTGVSIILIQHAGNRFPFLLHFGNVRPCFSVDTALHNLSNTQPFVLHYKWYSFYVQMQPRKKKDDLSWRCQSDDFSRQDSNLARLRLLEDALPCLNFKFVSAADSR